MSIVNNGERLMFEVAGVFVGLAGVSRGVVAYLPNLKGKRPEAVAGGILDGKPVRLRDIRKADDGISYLANFEEVGLTLDEMRAILGRPE